MSTAHHLFESKWAKDVYKPTHKNHPCAIWVRESTANYFFLYELFIELCFEYSYRYGRTHLTQTKMGDVLMNAPENLPSGPITEPAQAMPEEYKGPDVVNAYRRYYLGDKSSMLKWKGRERPRWVDNHIGL